MLSFFFAFAGRDGPLLRFRCRGRLSHARGRLSHAQVIDKPEHRPYNS